MEVKYELAKRNGNPKLTVGGLSGRFKRISELYRLFSQDWKDCLDYSDESLIELCNHESLGMDVKSNNGFLHGKRMLSLTVTMWKEDIEKGLLFKNELYKDTKYPNWWLNSIFKEKYHEVK